MSTGTGEPWAERSATREPTTCKVSSPTTSASDSTSCGLTVSAPSRMKSAAAPQHDHVFITLRTAPSRSRPPPPPFFIFDPNDFKHLAYCRGVFEGFWRGLSVCSLARTVILQNQSLSRIFGMSPLSGAAPLRPLFSLFRGAPHPTFTTLPVCPMPPPIASAPPPPALPSHSYSATTEGAQAQAYAQEKPLV